MIEFNDESINSTTTTTNKYIYQIIINITGMTCSSCVSKITNKLLKIKDYHINDVKINLLLCNGIVTCTMNNNNLNINNDFNFIKKSIISIGFQCNIKNIKLITNNTINTNNNNNNIKY